MKFHQRLILSLLCLLLLTNLTVSNNYTHTQEKLTMIKSVITVNHSDTNSYPAAKIQKENFESKQQQPESTIQFRSIPTTIHPECETKIEIKVENEAEIETKPIVEIETEAKIETEVEPKIETEIEIEIETEVEPKIETETEAEVETEVEPKIETVIETNKPSITEELIATALTYEGTRYSYGGTSPKDGFDCSGFVWYIYNEFGYSIGRTSAAQSTAGYKVDRNDLQPGDILIFQSRNRSKIGHSGIYIGNGAFIHAECPKTGVIVTYLSETYYDSRFVCARRIIDN